MRILFVSNDKSLEQVSAGLAGHSVEFFEDIASAQSSGQAYDVVFIDDQIDGAPQWINQARDAFNCKVVLITSSMSIKDIRNHQRSDDAADAYLTTPVSLSTINETLGDMTSQIKLDDSDGENMSIDLDDDDLELSLDDDDESSLAFNNVENMETADSDDDMSLEMDEDLEVGGDEDLEMDLGSDDGDLDMDLGGGDDLDISMDSSESYDEDDSEMDGFEMEDDSLIIEVGGVSEKTMAGNEDIDVEPVVASGKEINLDDDDELEYEDDEEYGELIEDEIDEATSPGGVLAFDDESTSKTMLAEIDAMDEATSGGGDLLEFAGPANEDATRTASIDTTNMDDSLAFNNSVAHTAHNFDTDSDDQPMTEFHYSSKSSKADQSLGGLTGSDLESTGDFNFESTSTGQTSVSNDDAARITRSVQEMADNMVKHLNQDEMAHIQGTLRDLRSERDRHLGKITDLETENRLMEQDNLSLKSELEEVKLELSIMKKRQSTDKDDLRQQLVLSEEKKTIYEEKMKRLEKEFDKLNQKVRFDINKVRQRERDLENQLELVKMDSESQIKSRDIKILELKRKIDALEFNIENASIKEQKSLSDKYKLEDKLSKVMQTLKRSMKVIEEDVELEVEDDSNETVEKV